MKRKNPKYYPSGKEFNTASIDALLANKDFWIDAAAFSQEEAAKKINSRIGETILYSQSRVRIIGLFKYAALLLILIMASAGWYYYASTLQMINDTEDTQAFILPDESEVLLSSGSVLSYKRSFGNKSRDVKLEGKAFFNVAENPDLPFKLNYQDQVIKVLGTEFIVEAEGQFTKVYLLEGSILWEGMGQTLQMVPGEKLELKSGQLIRKEEAPSRSHDLLGEEILIDNWTLAEAIEKINELYGMDVIKINDGLMLDDCVIHTRFRTGQLDDFIEEIEFLFKIKLRSYKGSFIIEDINCNS